MSKSTSISINVSDKPIFTRPGLLLHPSIPLYLFGINPRTLLGQEWWDVTRKTAYARNNHCCWVCGAYQLDTPSGKLDAHECYDYNTRKFEARLAAVVALCRECHKFIHWRGTMYGPRRQRIILRGFKILEDAGLPLPEGQVDWMRTWGWLGGWMPPKGWKTQVDMPFEIRTSSRWRLVLSEDEQKIRDAAQRDASEARDETRRITEV